MGVIEPRELSSTANVKPFYIIYRKTVETFNNHRDHRERREGFYFKIFLCVLCDLCGYNLMTMGYNSRYKAHFRIIDLCKETR